MRRILMAGTLVIAAATTSACSRDVTRGAGFGALGGAAAGALVPGLGVAEGAAVGAAGGAVIGAVTSDGDRRYQRDRRGREYWIDKNGRRRYR